VEELGGTMPTFEPRNCGERNPVDRAKHKWDGLQRDLSTAKGKKSWADAVNQVLRFEPLTLPVRNSSRPPEPLPAGARAADFAVCKELLTVFMMRVEAETGAVGGGGGGGGGGAAAAEEDLFGAGAAAAAEGVTGSTPEQAAAAEAYWILERILREFAPSLFVGDRIEPAAWPWNIAAVETAVAVAAPPQAARRDFLFAVDSWTDTCFLLEALLKLGVNDRLARVIAERLIEALTVFMAEEEKLAAKGKKRVELPASYYTLQRQKVELEALLHPKTATQKSQFRTPLVPPPDEVDAVARTANDGPEEAARLPRPRSWSFARFQLRHMGPYMPRPVGVRDTRKRVPFVPDQFQLDLLDAVDERQSTLVVAPTSSGKTFIAFYAMQKVLVDSDEDVVVYVAPSAALVDQVADEADARFSKPRNLKAGRPVAGKFTANYVFDALNCQILCCEPAS